MANGGKAAGAAAYGREDKDQTGDYLSPVLTQGESLESQGEGEGAVRGGLGHLRRLPRRSRRLLTEVGRPEQAAGRRWVWNMLSLMQWASPSFGNPGSELIGEAWLPELFPVPFRLGTPGEWGLWYLLPWSPH